MLSFLETSCYNPITVILVYKPLSSWECLITVFESYSYLKTLVSLYLEDSDPIDWNADFVQTLKARNQYSITNTKDLEVRLL